MNIKIGTSGWSYNQWKPGFYPAASKAGNWLEVYAANFDTVEINNSFYRVPAKPMVDKWRLAAPDGFEYSIKAWQAITHEKRLKNCDDEIALFFTMISFMAEKLGVILFQLPPSLAINLKLLEEFINNLPQGYKYSFEFRHPSWFCEDVYKIMKNHNIALTLSHMVNWQTPLLLTADFVYMRLHKASAAYEGKYPAEFIDRLANWMERAGADKNYIYFNNTLNGIDAVENARELAANMI